VSRNSSPEWDFYADWSEVGKRILFCRAAVGEAPCVWIMDSDGNHHRMLTQGVNKQGATHPRWVYGRPQW
jgi:Tol biopolymer transport system component